MTDPSPDSAPHPAAPSYAGRVDSPEALAACIAALGILPLRAAPPWPTLSDVRAPGVSLAEIWKWGGTLVAARQIFCGRVLGGEDGLAFTSPEVAIAALALTLGTDPMRVYMAGRITITAKAITDVLLTHGPMRVQQIRQAMRLHKRFLAHDVPPALRELECALLIVAGGSELTAGWQFPAPPAVQPPAPPDPPARRSRWHRQIAHDLDLRVWELTGRWALPEWLAAADRLREHPAHAAAILLAAAQALNPGAAEAEVREWLGWPSA